MSVVTTRPLGKLERLAYERQARDLERWPARSLEECEPDGFWWDEEAADRVVHFIESFCRHHKGEWAGQPFLLEEWQREIVRTVFGWRRPDGTRRFRTAYVEVPRKNGKGLAVDEWLPTPAGWVRAGDVRPGDMLFGRDGRPTRVLGVYPQPEQPLYRITFADGASVVVDGPHRWLVQVRDSSDGRWKEWTVMTTHELIQRGIAWRDGRGGFCYRFRIPVPEAVQYPEADLPIDPYLMGAWLGDGHVRATDAGITSADDDVLMACAALAPCTYVIDRPEGRTTQIRFHKPMRDTLAALGLAECKAHTKRIPRIYLQSSIAQRWALLQGLLDTDGFASKAGQIEFTTVSRELAEDVTELVRSLGGIVTSCVGRTPTYVSNGERRLGRVSWRMLVQLPEGTQAFRLQRKQERLRPRNPGWQLAKWRQIIGIEPVGVGRSVCFTVDAPDSLFLAGRGFIATHNTELAAAVALYLLVADGEEGAEVYSAAPLALDTPILTTRGWTTMGELQVGDEVFAEDGRPTTVTYLSPIVYRTTYRVCFDDGSELIATDNHLWTLEKRYTPRKGASQKYKTVTVSTEEIARSVTYGGRPRYRIKVAAPLRFDPKPLPIDPYVLGVWLGDGRSNRGSIVVDKGDLEIVREIERRGYTFSPHYSSKCNLVYGTIIGIRTALRQMGLLDNKRIPEVYKMASAEQRLDLLCGLMDTDGTVTKSGECRFVSICERLATDVHELVLGLGFKAHIRSVPTNGRSDAWIVSFKAYDDTPVFNLSRKRERQIQRNSLNTQARYRWIVAVEEVDPKPARCIAVDSPSHLFLAGDRLIATHNTKRDQAKIVHDAAVQMVRRSPELRRFVEVYRNNLSVPALNAKFEPLSSDSDTLDGLNPHAAILDELHAHKDRHVRDVLLTGMGARRQPLEFIITTAGVYDPTSIGWEQHEYARSILEGVFEDESYYAFIAAADDGDDWEDPETWWKANPNLGVSVRHEYLEELADRARRSPSFLNTFLRYHLNVWTQQLERWITPEIWKKGAAPVNEDALEGERCFAALDLSSTTDLTALALAFPNDVGGYDLVMRYWIPEDRVLERVRRDRVPYDAWVRDGWIRATPGDVVDYDFIREEVHELADRFEIVELAYDPWNATQLAVQLMGDGLPMVEFRQGYKTMSPAAKEFERLAVAGRLRHGGHPVLAWNVNNLAIAQDPAGNIKPDKQRSREKIDGAVAAIMAIGRASVQLGGEDANPYASGGFFVLG